MVVEVDAFSTSKVALVCRLMKDCFVISYCFDIEFGGLEESNQ